MNAVTNDEALPPFEVTLRQAPGATRTAYVVYNAVAGASNKRKPELDAVCDRFLAHGWSVASLATRCPGDGTAAARHAVACGADVVVSMGGDGTLNEVTQALVGGEVPVGIVPIGTVNVLARELGLPLEPMEAVDAILHGEPFAIDIGCANGRYFTMMVGLGWDAAAAMSMMPQIKAVSGQLAYWVGAVQTFFGQHKAVRAKIVLEDAKGKKRRIRRLIFLMIVSNTGLYGDGALKFTPTANVRDGLLDLCLIRSARWYRALLHIVLTFLDRLRTVSDVEYFRAHAVTITTGRPFPYQIDGDPVGYTPVRIEIVPLGMKVMVPPTVPPTDPTPRPDA